MDSLWDRNLMIKNIEFIKKPQIVLGFEAFIIFINVLSTFSRLRSADFVKVAKSASILTSYIINIY